ncbi:MAG TPA: M3 family metallopeptidase [Polyangiaceae bacterium]|nr:M3 family metallopeptidase [Polyangiaceae bacterium]
MRTATELTARLVELSSLFEANVHAGTLDHCIVLTEPSQLAGLCAEQQLLATEAARLRNVEGYVLTLQPSRVAAALESVHDRSLRKAIYEAYFTRASDHGPRAGHFDNTPVLDEVLELRYQLARLKGCQNYAELALQGGPITSPDLAERYLLSAEPDLKAKAQAALDEIWAFAKQQGAPRGFASWDLWYYASWLVAEKVGLSASREKQLFPLSSSVHGVLAFAERLFGVSFEPRSTARALCYGILAEDGSSLGELRLSLEDGERTGGGRRVALQEDPSHSPASRVLDVHCGLVSALEGPKLLSFRAVGALFETLGEGLARLLVCSKASEDRPPAKLIALVTAAVFRHCARHFEVLSPCTSDGGGGFDAEMHAQVLRRFDFASALERSQSLELALFDLRIHRDYVPTTKATQLRAQVLDTFAQVRRERSVLPPSYWTRFANTATEIFTAGRGATLWQRTWAEKAAENLTGRLAAEGFSAPARRWLREALRSAAAGADWAEVETALELPGDAGAIGGRRGSGESPTGYSPNTSVVSSSS